MEKIEKDISLRELFVLLKQHLGKIIGWGLVGLTISAVYTFFLATPQYQSTSKIVVNQTQNTGQAITNNDIQTNLNLIYTYQSIIKEPIILEEVMSTLDNELTLNELRDKITIQTQNESLVFGITVTDDNPYNAAKLANAIASSFERKIGNILEVESVTILSQATPALNAVSPNPVINLVAGLIIGLIIGIGLSLLNEMLNNTVKDESLIESLGWINLGSVFELSYEEVQKTQIMNQPTTRKTINNNLKRRI